MQLNIEKYNILFGYQLLVLYIKILIENRLKTAQ